MRRKLSIIAIVVLLLTAGVVGVRLADPFTSPVAGDVGAIDPSDPPGEVAAAALTDRYTRSHTAQVTFDVARPNGTNASPLVEGTQKLRYDADDHQIRYWGPKDHRGFMNAHYRWTRESNRTSERTDSPLPTEYTGHQTVMDCGCVTVQSENESTVVLVIEDNSTAARAMGLSAGQKANLTLTLVVDVDDSELRKLVFKTTIVNYRGERHIQTITFVYSNWGATEVERPRWAGYSGEELLQDLLQES